MKFALAAPKRGDSLIERHVKLSRLGLDAIGKLGEIANSIGIEFCWIPAGEFMMGSPDDDPEAYQDEKPQHLVNIERAFWMSRFTITQAQYQRVMGCNPSHFKGDRRPVETVSWHDAMAFCRKLTMMDREAGILPPSMYYTLPDEEQWEYACRAGTTGSRYGDLEKIAVYNQSETAEVGTKDPNAWGLYDMLGNVWEWTSSIYEPYADKIARREKEKIDKQIAKEAADRAMDEKIAASRSGDASPKAIQSSCGPTSATQTASRSTPNQDSHSQEDMPARETGSGSASGDAVPKVSSGEADASTTAPWRSLPPKGMANSSSGELDSGSTSGDAPPKSDGGPGRATATSTDPKTSDAPEGTQSQRDTGQNSHLQASGSGSSSCDDDTKALCLRDPTMGSHQQRSGSQTGSTSDLGLGDGPSDTLRLRPLGTRDSGSSYPPGSYDPKDHTPQSVAGDGMDGQHQASSGLIPSGESTQYPEGSSTGARGSGSSLRSGDVDPKGSTPIEEESNSKIAGNSIQAEIGTRLDTRSDVPPQGEAEDPGRASSSPTNQGSDSESASQGGDVDPKGRLCTGEGQARSSTTMSSQAIRTTTAGQVEGSTPRSSSIAEREDTCIQSSDHYPCLGTGSDSGYSSDGDDIPKSSCEELPTTPRCRTDQGSDSSLSQCSGGKSQSEMTDSGSLFQDGDVDPKELDVVPVEHPTSRTTGRRSGLGNGSSTDTAQWEPGSESPLGGDVHPKAVTTEGTSQEALSLEDGQVENVPHRSEEPFSEMQPGVGVVGSGSPLDVGDVDPKALTPSVVTADEGQSSEAKGSTSRSLGLPTEAQECRMTSGPYGEDLGFPSISMRGSDYYPAELSFMYKRSWRCSVRVTTATSVHPGSNDGFRVVISDQRTKRL